MAVGNGSGGGSVVAPEKSARKAKRSQRGSRNKKKNMRRKIDMSELNDHADELRHEERTGGPKSKFDDTALFFLDDVKRDVAMENEVDDATTSKKKAKAGAKRGRAAAAAAAAEKPLGRKARARSKVMAHEKLLAANPHVKAPPLMPSAKTELTVDKLLEQKRRYVRGVLEGTSKMPEREEEHALNEEAWDKKGVVPDESGILPDGDWLKPAEKAKVKRPNLPRGPEASAAAAVEVAVAGQSYNPTFEDHQALLARALQVEEALLQERERIRAQMPSTTSWKKVLDEVYREMAEGVVDFTTVTMEQVMEDDGEEAVLSLNPAVTHDGRKTQAQRNKEKRHRERMVRQQEEKMRKKRERGVQQVEALLAELKRQEAKHRKTVEERNANKEEFRQKHPRTFTRHKFKEPKLELKLTEELTGSLRQLEPEGDALVDRLNSLTRRNILPYVVKDTRPKRPTRSKPRQTNAQKEFDRLDKLKEKAKLKAREDEVRNGSAAPSAAVRSVARSTKPARRKTRSRRGNQVPQAS